MRVTRDKNCYCHNCERSFHYLGIASHRSQHRRRHEVCVITFTDGTTKMWKYSHPDETEGSKS